MPATIDQIRAILISEDFTPAEKYVVRMQFRQAIPAGNFEEKLWELICAADEGNQDLLAQVFPLEVTGFRKWAYGDLGKRIRQAGCDI